MDEKISRRASVAVRRVRTPLAAALLVASLLATVRSSAQEFIEVDGLDLVRPSGGAAAPMRRLLPHHDFVLLDPGAELALELVDSAGGRFALRPQGTETLAGGKAARFGTPLVAPGAYVLKTVGGDDRELGRFEVPYFRCYFNRAGDPRQARVADEIVPHVVLQWVMARYIDRAERTLDIAMSDFDHPEFVAAIVRAKNRGVRVRIVTDAREEGGSAAARRALAAAGVPLITNGRDVAKDPMMHHKFTVLDGRVVLTGHAKGDLSHAVFNQTFVAVNSPELAAVYAREFREMWGGDGPTSEPSSRRFGKSKTSPRSARVKVGPVDVDVVFSPLEAPDRTLSTRPINLKLLELIGAMRSDAEFMATGFTDGEISKAMIQAGKARGTKTYGVLGHPDWTIENTTNPVVVDFEAADRAVADVVGSHDTDSAGDYASVQNRAISFDVLDPAGRAIVCFSSGPWRRGAQESDDLMIVIPDRPTAEQFLQHFGGTRLRARAPLASRIAPARLRMSGSGPTMAAMDVLRYAGGRFERHGDAIRLAISDQYLSIDPRDGRAAALALGADADGRVPLARLARLGIGLRIEAGAPRLRLPGGCDAAAEFEEPANSADAAAYERRDGEELGEGLVVVSAEAMTLEPAAIRIDERGVPLLSKRSLAVVAAVPGLKLSPAEGAADESIYMEPEAAAVFVRAVGKFVAASGAGAAVELLDGGYDGAEPAGSLWKSWRPGAGEGVVVRLVFGSGDRAAAIRALVDAAAQGGFNMIGVDPTVVPEGADLTKVLSRPSDDDWKVVKGESARHSPRRQTEVSIVPGLGASLVQMRWSRWTYPKGKS